MAVDPLRYVAAPRFLGGIVAMPLLSGIFNLIGLYGALLVGVQLLGVDKGSFWSQKQGSLALRDLTEPIVKSLVFGVTWQSRSRVKRGATMRSPRPRRRRTRNDANRGRFVGARAAVGPDSDRGVS